MDSQVFIALYFVGISILVGSCHLVSFIENMFHILDMGLHVVMLRDIVLGGVIYIYIQIIYWIYPVMAKSKLWFMYYHLGCMSHYCPPFQSI